ncbi:MFS transporter [Arcanobacterium bovis]|uniref:MFS transporter n=1 Tax=Arcanobacterium bovis TaxID=2529275 RepID=A0A4Q9V2A8_9ACTO|nr:MFS transporter [Arcanobacterium bovis]TBW23718.1 MFS transporter [Arcanobacterium bovis]
MNNEVERPVKLDDLPMTRFLKRVTAYSSGGPFLEGYVLAIVGVALVPMGKELRIDAHWSGLIGVAALLGLFLGAFLGGWITDILGRKKMFVLDVLAIALLSLLCFFLTSPFQVFLLRFLIGVAIGADYPIATSMIAEFTPRRYRAISMGSIAAVWYLGANVAYLVGYFMIDLAHGWRWMLASSIVPCVIILLGRWSIPESPRWLHSKGRTEEAEAIMRSVFGRPVIIDDEVAEKTKLSTIFRRNYLWRVIFVAVIWLCQAIPMFAIYTYGPQIINQFGLGDGKAAFIGEIVIGMFFLLGTIPAMLLTEHWGRRPVVIWSFVIMTLTMAILGFLPAGAMAGVILCFVMYALASGGPGNLQWLYPNELFPTSVRATAMGVAMSLSRVATVVSIYVLPTALEKYGLSATMLAGAVISLLGLLVSMGWAPETKGLTLTETSAADFTGRKKK